MDAGPSSAPVLHQMQPPPRPQVPRPVPARVPGAPPVGALRPPVMVGQRAGPVVPMPANPTPRAPIPPQIFKFQAVKRPGSSSSNPSPTKVPTLHKPLPALPSRAPVPYSKPTINTPQNYTQRRVFHQNINGKSNSFNSSSLNPMAPSTSYADRIPSDIVQKPYTSPPTTSSRLFHDDPPKHDIEDQKTDVEKESTTIELPPNCKLFQYSCEVNGVSRTLLVPMPADATEDDVMKMLPESFSEMASKIFQEEVNVAQTELPKLAIPTVDEPKEEPVLVNPKQFWRIQKRREMRMRLENSGRLPTQRQKYLHESRHRHAINRKRGIDGRFDPKSSDRDEHQETSSPPSGPQYRTTPRPARTYAAIRPAGDAGSHYGPMSSAGSTTTAYFANEPITSYHQYQQHVQYTSTDHYQSSSVSNGASTSDNGGEGTSDKQPSPSDQQNFTNL